MAEPVFKCAKCGADTDLAAPNPADTACQNCCEDHDYEYDTAAEWSLCRYCSADAPDDYYQETGLDVGSGEPC